MHLLYYDGLMLWLICVHTHVSVQQPERKVDKQRNEEKVRNRHGKI